MRFEIQLPTSALAAILALSACSSSGNEAMLGNARQAYPARYGANDSHIVLVHPAKRACPRKYTLGCASISPSGPGETITFSCSGGSSCPVPKWLMYNILYTVEGKSAKKDLIGKWDPNPYYSGPGTHTINLVSERRALKPSRRVRYFEVLLACPAQSSCTGLGTVGLIPVY